MVAALVVFGVLRTPRASVPEGARVLHYQGMTPALVWIFIAVASVHGVVVIAAEPPPWRLAPILALIAFMARAAVALTWARYVITDARIEYQTPWGKRSHPWADFKCYKEIMGGYMLMVSTWRWVNVGGGVRGKELVLEYVARYQIPEYATYLQQERR